MATIYHQVGIKAPLTAVYNAIATTDGVSKWWTKTIGETNAGGQLDFQFGAYTVSAMVTENQPEKCVEWTVQGEAGEWLATRISFELEEHDDQVIVNFQHADWEAATPMLAHCSTKWAVFLLSLKDCLETGTGRPFPGDIQINHSED